MEELRSSRLKLQRANVHIKSLNRSIKRFLERNNDAVVLNEPDLKGFGKMYTINPAAPDSWGLMAGDVLSNMRASLDHIAWALATKHKKGQIEFPRAVQFPIFDDKDKYRNESPRMINEVLPTAHAEIARVQPYNAPDWPETDYLRVLNILVNDDKHRLLTSTVVQAQLGPAAILNPGRNTWNSPVFRQPYKLLIGNRITEALEKQNLKPKLTTFVTFSAENSPIDGYAIDYLSLIHNFIRDEIIPRFAGFFK